MGSLQDTVANRWTQWMFKKHLPSLVEFRPSPCLVELSLGTSLGLSYKIKVLSINGCKTFLCFQRHLQHGLCICAHKYTWMSIPPQSQVHFLQHRSPFLKTYPFNQKAQCPLLYNLQKHFAEKCKSWSTVASLPPLSLGGKFQKPQQMPETLDNAKPHIYLFFPIHTLL